MEDNKPLRVPAALPDSREFRSQRLDEAAPDPPARRVVPPSGHHLHRLSSGLSFMVSLDPPTEVRSIVGVHQVSLDLLDPPVLLRGYVPQQIPHKPLPVLRLLWRTLCCCRCHSHLSLFFSRGSPCRCRRTFAPRHFLTPPYSLLVVWYSTSDRRDGTLVHPRHWQSSQCCTAFRQTHLWVLQAEIVPHLQQAPAGSLPELSCVPPVSISSSSPVPSIRASSRAVVDI